jgi:hypothetical protein
MTYCPHCGNPTDEAGEHAPEEVAARTMSRAEVEIAKINADKEIRLAKIAAGSMEHADDARVEEAILAPEPEVVTEPDPGPAIVVEQHAEDIDGGEVHEQADESSEEVAEAPPEEGENHEDTGRRGGYGSKLWYG